MNPNGYVVGTIHPTAMGGGMHEKERATLKRDVEKRLRESGYSRQEAKRAASVLAEEELRKILHKPLWKRLFKQEQ